MKGKPKFRFALLVLAALLAGCNSKPPVAEIKPPAPDIEGGAKPDGIYVGFSNPAELYDALMAECKKRHLMYRVMNDVIKSDKFMAAAWNEKGDMWIVTGVSGPTEAAEKLFNMLGDPPTRARSKPFDTGIVTPK